MGRISPTKKFTKEVLDKGAEACLPANLSDDWIHYLDTEMSNLDNVSDSVDENLSCSLAAVVTIINARSGGGYLFKAIFSELISNVKEYRNEIALEIFRRRTENKCEPATLENIFRNRVVNLRQSL